MAEIILVTSGKGGAGKSSFTAGVSRALAADGKKVLKAPNLPISGDSFVPELENELEEFSYLGSYSEVI